jgi:hypothetical protein
MGMGSEAFVLRANGMQAFELKPYDVRKLETAAILSQQEL